jgi:creatinine amidohydrolase
MESRLFKLTRPEVEEYLKNNDTILVPIGSTEQHGKHMALDTDAFTAQEISLRVAKETGVLVAPVISYGYSPHHMNFPGSITLTFRTLVNVLKEVCQSLIHHGFKKIVLMNAHGGNTNSIRLALKEIEVDTGVRVYSVMVYPMLNGFGADGLKVCEQESGGHACELETSVGLELGHRILMDRAEKWKAEYRSIDPNHRGKVTAAYMFDEHTRIGNLGDPTLASKEKGKILVKSVVEDLAKFVIDLKKR